MKRLKKYVIASPILRSLAFGLNRIQLRSKGNSIAKKVKIGFSTVLEGQNHIAYGVSIFGSELGFGSYISENSHFSKTKIGRYCSIGRNITCIFGKHPTKDFVSTHPAFFSTHHSIGFTYVDKDIFVEHAEARDDKKKYAIVVGNDVWLGDNVSLMEGIVIGDGAIVAANALVTKDVPPYTIVGGVPAKKIKQRFADEEIDFLLKIKWWNKSISWIKQNAVHFNDIERFKKYFA